MNVEQVPVGELTEHPANPRQGDVGAIVESIQEHGWFGAVVAQRSTRRILVGNHRVRAARDLGITEVPVHWLDVDDDEALRVLLVDNRTNDLASYDDSALAGLLTDLAQSTERQLAGTGFDGDALDQLLADLAAADLAGRAQEDTPPGEPPAEPVTRPGDLWVLGDHRLLCGDATKRDEYAALMAGEQAALMVSDPPYGVSHGSGVTTANAIRGDLGQAAIPLGFSCSLDMLTTDGRLYLFGGSSQFAMYLGLWDHHLHAQPRIIVWVKESFVLRQIAYHSRYELIYWGWKGKGGGPDFWYGDRLASDVWQVARDGANEREHPTQKPVEVFAIPIRSSSAPGDAVLDPFAGSGPAVIACENLGRAARLIEIDPGYCDVICERWQRHTGRQPERDGTAHDFTANR